MDIEISATIATCTGSGSSGAAFEAHQGGGIAAIGKRRISASKQPENRKRPAPSKRLLRCAAA
ncbi:hypothetical protein ZHAS_00010814 [Anopheles sinensis]|uniref:Uncharacterized protein n=1 Tax=Anopheles sinensis TaxID=74873 RepID=A0A084VYA0_ANOSI|nr:hypothetical protein ZHAS_00010814 [Anopheles sinensis]